MPMRNALRFLLAAGCVVACDGDRTADLLILNGRVYSLSWPDPSTDGTPDARAPHDANGWHPDAEAVAVLDGRIQFVGSDEEAQRYRGPGTTVLDVDGATVLPGLVDSHAHIANLGANLERVILVGVETEEEVVRRVAQRAADIPEGQWIVGWGWDEGAWASRYPDNRQLSLSVPRHPVILRGLHSYAVWGNELAFQRAGITAATQPPTGGEILKDARGRPTGILLNRAVQLLDAAIPPATDAKLQSRVVAGLGVMARDGYTAVHEAGADGDLMEAFEALDAEGALPLRVYAMLDGRDEALLRSWAQRGPDRDSDRMLTTRSVKAFYDGALGSRGARLLEDYSDLPGSRGVSGAGYGFDEASVERMIEAGFQVAIHAIGDAANHESLDFLERMAERHPESRGLRHRIEHAQVLDPQDVGRFAELDVIASMEPSHAVEDKAWAEDRLGPERVRLAYAWRTIRQTGARLTFNSDLPGSDHDIFYGLHSAITRKDRSHQPPGGWHPGQTLTPEEAVRAYTVWAAYAAGWETQAGTLTPGRWADITVLDIDPLRLGDEEPERLLQGSVLLTLVAGNVVHNALRSGTAAP